MCPDYGDVLEHLMGALISWVSFKRGSTLMPLKEQIVSVLISNHENKQFTAVQIASFPGHVA